MYYQQTLFSCVVGSRKAVYGSQRNSDINGSYRECVEFNTSLGSLGLLP